MPQISEVVRLYFALLCIARSEAEREKSPNNLGRMIRAERNFRYAVKSFARARLCWRDLRTTNVVRIIRPGHCVALKDDTTVDEGALVGFVEAQLSGH